VNPEDCSTIPREFHFPERYILINRPDPSLAIIRLAVLAALLVSAGVALLIVGTHEMVDLLEAAADSRWGVVAFFVVFVIATVILVPGTFGTVTAGAVFSFGVGFPLALVSATVGATIAFGDRLSSIDDWLGKNDFLSIFVLRLMPIVPFNGLNYAAGLTGVRPSRYVAATALGILPGTALFTFASSRASDPSSTSFLLASGALLALVLLSSVGARTLASRRRDEASSSDQ
jgi:uncharacterized membrane protein YdjX (TVP38/TMEM64 family)